MVPSAQVHTVTARKDRTRCVCFGNSNAHTYTHERTSTPQALIAYVVCCTKMKLLSRRCVHMETMVYWRRVYLYHKLTQPQILVVFGSFVRGGHKFCRKQSCSLWIWTKLFRHGDAKVAGKGTATRWGCRIKQNWLQEPIEGTNLENTPPVRVCAVHGGHGSWPFMYIGVRGLFSFRLLLPSMSDLLYKWGNSPFQTHRFPMHDKCMINVANTLCVAHLFNVACIYSYVACILFFVKRMCRIYWLILLLLLRKK